MVCMITIDYQVPQRRGLLNLSIASWVLLTLVVCLSFPPVYVYLAAWIRQLRDPTANPFQWFEHHHPIVGLLCLIGTIGRPVIAVLILAVMLDRPMHWTVIVRGIIAIAVALAAYFFEHLVQFYQFAV
jgi:hypothetical protein